jgi:hypothetical protein
VSKLVRLLIEETGLSEEQARQVATFLALHPEVVEEWREDWLPDTVRPPAASFTPADRKL